MFKKMISFLLVISCMAFVLAGCGGSKSSTEGATGGDNSGDTGTIAFRMSQASSETGAIGRSMDKFSEMIAERTGNRYTVNTFHNGQLGGERDNIEACQIGNLDIAVVNQAPLSNFVSDIAAVDLPYVIENYQHADNVFLGDVGHHFLDELSKVGIVGLTIWESGFRNLTNSKKEVHSLADVAGLRVRVMENKIHQDLWKTLGADPVAMAWNDAYTALQQRAIDGQENPATVIDKNNVVEVNKNMAITEHVYSTVFIIMSPKAWNSLSPEDQKIFKQAAVDAGLAERELSRQMDEEAITTLEGNGMKVTRPDKQEFIVASQPVRDKYGKKYAEILKQIEAEKPR